jgi:hypothetical protein
VSVFSPFQAANATLALKAALWFRRGRLLIMSPVPQPKWLCLGQQSTTPMSRSPEPPLWDHLRTSNPIEKGGAVARHRQVDGVQVGHRSCKNLAAAKERKLVAQSHPGRRLYQQRRDHQHARTERRLITALPKFLHSSPSPARDSRQPSLSLSSQLA